MLRAFLSNTFFSLITDVSTRLSTALLMILLARRLGETAAGVYTLSNNYILILSAVALWGLDQLLIPKLSQDSSQTTKVFSHFYTVRLVLGPLLWLMLAALLLGGQIYQPDTNRFIALAGGVLIGNSLSNLVQALLVVEKRMRLSAVVAVVVGALLVACSAIAIAQGLPLEVIAALLVAASWLQAAVLTWSVRRNLWPAGFRFDPSFCRLELAAGLPFVPIILFMALEAQLGGILLSLFRSETAVGYYGMANTIVAALALLSQAVRIGSFPAMAETYRADGERFARLYKRMWRYLSIIAMPLVILLVVLAEWLIHMLYRSSAPDAVTTLQLLAPTLVFYFINIPNARLMILENRQRVLATLFALSGAVNLLAGFLLIPVYGAPGVAVARVVSMSVLFGLTQYYVYRRILAVPVWRYLWQPLVAAAAMAALLFLPLADASLVVRCLVGTAVYVALAVSLRAIPPEEWRWLQDKWDSWDFRSRMGS
jgi:O-antigen/teichoic acid export membrane protein